MKSSYSGLPEGLPIMLDNQIQISRPTPELKNYFSDFRTVTFRHSELQGKQSNFRVLIFHSVKKVRLLLGGSIT